MRLVRISIDGDRIDGTLELLVAQEMVGVMFEALSGIAAALTDSGMIFAAPLPGQQKGFTNSPPKVRE